MRAGHARRVALGRPEGQLHRCAIDQMGQRLGIGHHDTPGVNQAAKVLDNLRKARIHQEINPFDPHHRRHVTEHDAPPRRLQHGVQIGVIAGAESRPAVVMRLPDRIKLPADLGIDLFDYCPEQPRLVAKVMVQGPPRHPGPRRKSVERHRRIPFLGKGLARHGQQPRHRLRRGLGAAPLDLC